MLKSQLVLVNKRSLWHKNLPKTQAVHKTHLKVYCILADWQYPGALKGCGVKSVCLNAPMANRDILQTWILSAFQLSHLFSLSYLAHHKHYTWMVTLWKMVQAYHTAAGLHLPCSYTSRLLHDDDIFIYVFFKPKSSFFIWVCTVNNSRQCLASNSQHVIIWTNGGLVICCIFAFLGLDELTKWARDR